MGNGGQREGVRFCYFSLSWSIWFARPCSLNALLPPPLTISSANSWLRPKHTRTSIYSRYSVMHVNTHRCMHITCACHPLQTWTFNASEYYKRRKLLIRHWSCACHVLSGLELAFTQGYTFNIKHPYSAHTYTENHTSVDTYSQFSF